MIFLKKLPKFLNMIKKIVIKIEQKLSTKFEKDFYELLQAYNLDNKSFLYLMI